VSEQRIRQFVDFLYPPGSKLPEGARFSLWEMPGKRSYHYLLPDPELEVAAHALDQEGHNVFFGVGLRRGDLGPMARGAKAEIVALPGFWADVDIKGINHVADNLPANIIDVVKGILQPFDWEPSLVVNSGGGIHAYWLFETPLWITDENREEIEEMSRAFQERLAIGARNQGWKWDMTADTPRVLRPVGTHNRKQAHPVPVEFMGTPGGMRYSYSLFQAALKTKAGGIASILARANQNAPIGAVPSHSLDGAPTSPPRTIDTRTSEEILEQLRTKMRKNRKTERKEIIEQILNGEPFATTGERDKVLQQVASWIGFYDNAADPEVLVEVLIASLEAMAAAQPGGAMTVDDAVAKISRAQADARRKAAVNQHQQDSIREALMRQTRQAYQAPPRLPPADLVVVPPPPTADSKPSPKALPLDQVLRDKTKASLAVVPALAPDASATEAPTGEYSEAEINSFRARQSALTGESISWEEWKKRWVLVWAESVYIFVNGRYRSPIPRSNYLLSAQRDLSLLPMFVNGVYYFSPTGFKNDGAVRVKNTEECWSEIGTVVRHVVADTSISESYYDSRTETFYEAVCPLRQDLTPKEDLQIQTWLKKLGGPDADKLLDWVATVTFLGAPSCGLFLSGPPDAGKSLLANGLARLWHTGGATRMEEVVGSFNADVSHCPLVMADETLPETSSGKTISTKRLRDLISADSRPLKRKFMANTNLKGTIRCMFLANSEKLLDLGDEILGNDSIAAVAMRFLHIQVSEDAVRYINSIGGRHGGTRDWIDGDQIARHALWLRDTRKVVPSGRFWVMGHDAKMHRLLRTASVFNGQVAEWIITHLIHPKKEAKGSGAILAYEGQVWANAQTISKFWSSYIDTKGSPPPTQKIKNALLGMLDNAGRDENGGVMKRHRDKQMRYWGLKVETLIDWSMQLGLGDPDELLALINLPKPKEEKAKDSKEPKEGDKEA
jgi:hypothetical protein